MKSVALILASFICLQLAPAGETANPYLATLQSAKAAELPAKAAEIVTQAKGKREVGVQVVKAALQLNPAAAPAVVGAISRAYPDLAAEIAGIAAAEQPKLAVNIARAAAGGAPGKAGKITAEVCKAVPNQFRQIAISVADVVPGSSKDVLEGVAQAIPQLKPSIESSMSTVVAGSDSVALNLDKATVVAKKDAEINTAGSTATSFARGPSLGLPYIPLSGTPTNVTTGTGGSVPPGGRNYASP